MTLGGFLTRAELAGYYQQRFCTASAYTLDAAAACAFLDPRQVPPPVHAALVSALPVRGQLEPHRTVCTWRPRWAQWPP